MRWTFPASAVRSDSRNRPHPCQAAAAAQRDHPQNNMPFLLPAVPGIFCLQHGNVRLTILSSGKALYLFRFPLHMPDGPDSPVSL